MGTRLRTALLALGIAGAGAAAVEAQTSRAHFGPRLVYDFDAEELGIGVQVGIPVARRVELYPSFDYLFVDPGSLWSANLDFKYRVGRDDAGWLYVGSGLSIETRSVSGLSETDPGLNLILGAEPLRGTVHPFLELRGKLSDRSTFQIAGGFNITLPRN